MNKYLVVIHAWHVYSEGFTYHEIEALSDNEADKEASYLCRQRERDFRKCAYKCVKVEHNLPPSTRKLTLWERLTGEAKI